LEQIAMAFSPNAGKLAAYRSTAAHSGVDAADPHRLVVMLMDGALERIAAASGLMKHGGGVEKAQLLNRAVAIIDELRNSLNVKAGGAIATNLDSLYEYMCQRIMQANASNKPEWLDEVSRLLSEIRSAWLQLPQIQAQAGRR
jgi:flagellar protein FliS